jgi:PAS domain S-box-containing protein
MNKPETNVAIAEPSSRFLPDESFYRDLVDNGLGFICTHDLTGRIIWVNAAAADALGYESVEMTGELLTSFMAVPDRGIADYLRTLESNGRHEGTVAVRTRAGTERKWFFRNKVIRAEGQLPYVIGHAVDITEKSRNEAAVREAQVRFRMMADSAPALIWMADEKKQNYYYNRCWLEFTGRTLAEEAGDGWRDGVHREDVDRLSAVFDEAFGARTPYSIEYRRRRADGEYRWVLGTGVPLYGPDKKFEGYIGTCVDITPQKHVEQRLREQAELLDLAQDAIMVVDLEGRISFWNHGAERLYGWSAAEVAGKSVLALLRTEIPISREGVASAVWSDGRWLGEIMQYKRNGERMVVRSQEVQKYVNGKPVGSLVINTDVTSKVKADEMQQRFTAILEATTDAVSIADEQGTLFYMNKAGRDLLGIEQIADLPALGLQDRRPEWAAKLLIDSAIPTAIQNGVWEGESALVGADGQEFPVSEVLLAHRSPDGVLQYFASVARDMTERRELERLKDEFVSNVSHELRTPLTSIRGALGMLATGVLGTVPAKGQRMLDIAVANTDRLVRLINDILDIERMESGRIAMRKAEVDVAEVMTSATETMNAMAEKAGVSIELKPLAATLEADGDRLMQTFTNILSNAIKFSPRGATVRFEAWEADQAMTFCIRDEGRGIPEDKLKSIFGRFQQVDFSDAREKGGTGLGLAISHTIVEQHGGRIWAESELGQGSSFFIRLPAGPAQVKRPFGVSVESGCEGQR